MTAQAMEKIIWNGKETYMAAEPLEPFLNSRTDISFTAPNTSCWRGYYGRWEITENKLYLVGLEGFRENLEQVNVEYLFPGQQRVFAGWFTGEIRIPQGELLDYVHRGFESLYERDVILQIQNGEIIGETQIDNKEVIENRKPDPAIQKEVDDFFKEINERIKADRKSKDGKNE